jgi:acylglycerol lipase
LVLHGEADIVTDPSISKALYYSALSFDKEIKLYPGMWHGLTSGEPDENIEKVFKDIVEWLDNRSSSYLQDASSVSQKGSHGSTD